MQPDLWYLYRRMLYSRLFEQGVAGLWQEGLISGEMHLGMGEEAIAAGIVLQLMEEDALALDHRGTPPLLMRGVDPILLLREFLGCEDGLCAGQGGHMHLFSKEHLAVSSGIVGSAGPAAAGFALAAQHLRLGSVAVAFFGEGAMNQGMLLESFNLASAWRLPVLFVCKDSKWAITTETSSVTGGRLLDRARGFGLDAEEVDGIDVRSVWAAAYTALSKLRSGHKPIFLLAHCSHLEGHFLGDPILDLSRKPLKAIRERGPYLARALLGGPLVKISQRRKRLLQMQTAAGEIQQKTQRKYDPVHRLRQDLQSDSKRLLALEEEVAGEIQAVLDKSISG